MNMFRKPTFNKKGFICNYLGGNLDNMQKETTGVIVAYHRCSAYPQGVTLRLVPIATTVNGMVIVVGHGAKCNVCGRIHYYLMGNQPVRRR